MATNQFLQRQRVRQQAIRTGVCKYPEDFITLVKGDYKNRPSVLMEGDSWFAYPPEFLIEGKPRNIYAWLRAYALDKKLNINLFSLAENGDSARSILGKDVQELKNLVNKVGDNLDFLFMSAGGNDITGDSLPGCLNKYQDGFTARDCFSDEFYRRIDKIKAQYVDLLQYMRIHAPNAKIVTHSYCYLKPEPRGFAFLFFRHKTNWVYRHFIDKEIPPELHMEAVKHMLDNLHVRLEQLDHEYDNFYLIDMREGVLEVGNHNDWADEMHPTSSGFKKLAQKFVEKLIELDSSARS